MRRIRVMFLMSVILAAFSGSTVAGQDSLEGKWAGELREGNTINLSHNFRSRLPGKSSHDSTTMSLDNLIGLPASIGSFNGLVQFQLRRDSGTIFYSGSFASTVGAGEFRFVPDLAFAQQLGGRGYNNLSVDELFMMAVHNVSSDFINQVHTFGYTNVTIDQLFAMRIHKVTPEFIQSLKDARYNNVTADDLISMRIHRADADYIRQIKSLGYNNLSGDQIIAMCIHKVTVPFITDLHSLGYDKISADDLVRLRIHRVTPEFVGELNAQGRRGLSVDELIRIRRESLRTTQFSR